MTPSKVPMIVSSSWRGLGGRDIGQWKAIQLLGEWRGLVEPCNSTKESWDPKPNVGLPKSPIAWGTSLNPKNDLTKCESCKGTWWEGPKGKGKYARSWRQGQWGYQHNLGWARTRFHVLNVGQGLPKAKTQWTTNTKWITRTQIVYHGHRKRFVYHPLKN